MTKLLCYELNEVPWRVVDLYLQSRPDSHLAGLLNRSAQLTTHCNDHGELQPWSTWPTLHRGVSNEVHGINFLNQDLSDAGEWPPVWEILTSADVSVGVFGSLQSYPPLAADTMHFHIPDTFAAGPETRPERYSAFQAFNLKQTGDNKASAKGIDPSDIGNAVGLLRSGIKLRTAARVASHLVNERRNPLNKSRRALLQPELAFDVFVECLKRSQPDFVTFFSNHVAGIMHRYWKYSFPEDFEQLSADSERNNFHAQSLTVAMDIFDRQLATLEQIAKQHGYQIVILSSMGQEAIDRGEYIPELVLDDLNLLLQSLCLTDPVKMNLAMQPDIALEFADADALERVRDRLLTLVDSDGKSLFKQRYASSGLTLNLAMATSEALARELTAYVNTKAYPLDAIGLSLLTRDQGTGYHQPDGILIWEGLQSLMEPRATIDSRSVLPTVLEQLNVPHSAYMQPAIT